METLLARFAPETSVPELAALMAAAIMAGLVRGFSGFGTAMVYMPVAGQVLPPVWAVTTMVVMDAIGPLPNVPRALRDGKPRDVARIALGMLVMTPVGLYALRTMPPEAFRYTVSVVTLGLLVLLVGGLRYRGALTPRLLYVTGGVGGLFGGATGLAGPPVIMLYMASLEITKVIRANLLLVLVCADAIVLGLLALTGELRSSAIALGLAVMGPYLLANIAGAAMFNPDRAVLYRRVAYVIIAASALSGLPLWD
ncbi:hypothetical protein C8N43_1145 [Litoreibacter ponti]|uniref:Probable membrane transporter protein n=1 Tax=Litoreibacter ponti TaxID=1510457 RepID=A0A2T6BKB3_9RHOB|nr:sulfite exporter TauE/SafE family protein [Litoreibacter ponti]PTX56486.1 hypothetical protein C8N43_1145 [Litoreibacter ponti]